MATDPTIPPAYRAAVVREQIELTYQNIRVQLLANPTVGILIVAMLWELQSPSALSLWLGALLAVIGSRYLLWRRYRAKGLHSDSRRWGAAFAVTNVFLGLVWGMLVMAFFDQRYLIESMILIIAVAGFTAGSFGSHSAYLPAYVAFGSTAISLVALRLLLENDDRLSLLATLCGIYFAVLTAYARNAQRQIKAAIVARLQVEELNRALSDKQTELEAAKDRAERANSAKGRFLASASHDLRQPLHALRLFVDALAAETSAPKLQPLIANIAHSVTTLDDLFTNLLELAQTDAQAVRPRMRVIRVDEILERLAAEHQVVAADGGLALRIRPANAFVESDPVLLERILRNLLHNAIRYTRAGGILLGCRRRGDAIRLEIWDSGVGIPSDQLQSIFDEFHQVDNPERDRQKGLGLGLAIANRLAHAIGASIDVRSRPGRGSCFAVTLRRVTVTQSAPPTATPAAAAAEATGPTLNGIHIAFVDDDADVRIAMIRLLRSWGCLVTAADSGTGLNRLLSAAPQLVITDYRLRGDANGLDLIAALRRRYGSQVPAVLITGDIATMEDQEVAESDVRVLIKPVQPARLRILIERLVGATALAVRPARSGDDAVAMPPRFDS